MKTFCRGIALEVQYNFCDIEYAPAEGDGKHSPYFPPEIRLKRATVAGIDGNDHEAPDWLLDIINDDRAFMESVERNYTKEMYDRAIDGACYRYESITEAKFTAWR